MRIFVDVCSFFSFFRISHLFIFFLQNDNLKFTNWNKLILNIKKNLIIECIVTSILIALHESIASKYLMLIGKLMKEM